MGWHFRVVAVLTLAFLGLCAWLAIRFPDRLDGDTLLAEWANQADRVFLWAVLLAAAGTYGSGVALVAAHASGRRTRFWTTAVVSGLYLWPSAGGLATLLVLDGGGRHPNEIARMHAHVFQQVLCGACYAAALLLIWWKAGDERRPG